MPTALIACNPQYDYLPGGVIDAPNSLRVVNNLAQIAAQCDLVVATRYYHPENHFTFVDDPQFKDGSWPPYGVQGTKGSKIFRPLNKLIDYTISMGVNRNPPEDYSAFVGKTLRPVLSLGDILEGHPVDKIIVGGFLWEYNVKWTAYDANAIGLWTVVVPQDAVATLDNSIDFDHTMRAGIKVVDTWNEALNQ